MKISELIDGLEQAKMRWGDLEVTGNLIDSSPARLLALDADGCRIGENGKPVELFIE